jgi:hypothetical protein
MAAERNAASSRERSGFMLAVALLCAMTVCEVLFLKYVAGPDSVAMIAAAEGITMPQ